MIASPPRTVRLAVALGDAEREQRLMPELNDSGGMMVVARCLAGDELVETVRRERPDVVLVADDLHRLSHEATDALASAGVPVVVLTRDGSPARAAAIARATVPVAAEPEAVRQALLAAAEGRTPAETAIARQEELVEATTLSQAAPAEAATGLLVIVGPPGAPGRTTVAINLAAALGAVAPTILIDADFTAPSTVIQLDLDPTRNLHMLAHAEPETAADWDRALQQETQPLAPRSKAVVLCGVPKREMRRAVTGHFFSRLVRELEARYRYVVVDAGPELAGSDAAPMGPQLSAAAHVLIVTGADLPSLSRTRLLLRLLQDDFVLPSERLALVINGYDRRHHHSRQQIEWALGAGVAAVILRDYKAVQRALAAQQPLVLRGRSRSARALLDLAGRIHGGAIRLPEEEQSVKWPRLHLPHRRADRQEDKHGASA